jgi:hypothetical protein
MSKTIGIIALATIILLLLPAAVSLTSSSLADRVYNTQLSSVKPLHNSNPDQIIPQRISLCSSLLELPLMIGRPAPCIRNYVISAE